MNTPSQSRSLPSNAVLHEIVKGRPKMQLAWEIWELRHDLERAMANHAADLNAPRSESAAQHNWKTAALRLGEQLASTGPDDYYQFTPGQWLEWCERHALASAVQPINELEDGSGRTTSGGSSKSGGQPASALPSSVAATEGLSFAAFRRANVTRCVKWHPAGLESWSPSDWLTAVTGELGELASLLKMRNRERDGLPGNKFAPTDKQIADELADVLTYLDLLAAVLGVDLGAAAVEKFNEVSERVGFSDRIAVASAIRPLDKEAGARALATFQEYFIKNYPPDCILHAPAWHAPKIFRAALYAIEAERSSGATEGRGEHG